MEFMNETHFKRFLMIIRSVGFVDKSMIRSQNVLNFSYALYLKLKREQGNNPNIESWVRRWFVLSILTKRYSSSPESQQDKDIKGISESSFETFIQSVEAAELSDTFFDIGLVQDLTTSSVNTPAFKVYLAAQVKMNDLGFLSKEITVRDMVTHHGDIHHIFPRNFMKKKGYTRYKYNQIANFVMVQQEINIKIGDKPATEYMQDVFDQCESNTAKYGGIVDANVLAENLAINGLPSTVEDYDVENYEDFLMNRRIQMAQKIKVYYRSL
jgi:hypothetical protein